jgi:hypothetical protein
MAGYASKQNYLAGCQVYSVQSKERMNDHKPLLIPMFLCLLATFTAVRPASSEPLSSRVLALYPQEAGELVFVDLREARRSPYFAQMQAQILPPSFKSVAQLAASLGLDFNRNVDRLSWAYVNSHGNAAQSELMGVAEGSFDPEAVSKAVRTHKLTVAHFAGRNLFSMGSSQTGQEFVLAFTEAADCLFGFRADVEHMLTRSAEGGANVLNNDAMRRMVDEVNRDSPIWMVLNGDFTQLGVRQLLAEAIRMPGVDSLSSRVQTATVRVDLDRGLSTRIAARCASAADAMWFSTLLQGALVVERQLQADKSPVMARVIGGSQVQRDQEKVSLDLTVGESDLAALIQNNGLTLHF